MKRRIAFLSAALLLAVSLTGCSGEARKYFDAAVAEIPDVGITVNGKQLPVPSGDQIRGFLYTWSDWVEGEVDPYLNREDMKFIPEVASDLALLALKPGHVTDLKATVGKLTDGLQGIRDNKIANLAGEKLEDFIALIGDPDYVAFSIPENGPSGQDIAMWNLGEGEINGETGNWSLSAEQNPDGSLDVELHDEPVWDEMGFAETLQEWVDKAPQLPESAKQSVRDAWDWMVSHLGGKE